MGPRAETLSLPAALEVCRAMRPMDNACIAAARGHGFNRDAFAADRCDTDGPAWTFFDHEGPAVISGLHFTCGWTGTFWLVAHERVDAMPPSSQIWRKVIRQARIVIGNALDPRNPHHRPRIEALVLHGWQGASRLVERLGFEREGICRCSGSRGEDFEIWAQVAGGK